MRIWHKLCSKIQKQSVMERKCNRSVKQQIKKDIFDKTVP